jgi:hypothetical protein
LCNERVERFWTECRLLILFSHIRPPAFEYLLASPGKISSLAERDPRICPDTLLSVLHWRNSAWSRRGRSRRLAVETRTKRLP